MLKCLPSFQGAEQALRSGASCPCCGGCRGADSSQRPRYPWKTFYPLPACPSYLGCRGADSSQRPHYPWMSFYPLSAAPNNYLGCPVAIKLDLTRSGYIFWLQNSGLTGEVTKPSRTCYLWNIGTSYPPYLAKHEEWRPCRSQVTQPPRSYCLLST